jgi:hypothetical protein
LEVGWARPNRRERDLNCGQFLRGATVIAGLKIKAIRDAVREMARHDMNDSGWIFF